MLGDTFKALSDETRRKILFMLRDGEMTAGDIAERFNTSHATISHHLKMLRDAKLVLVERNGQNLIYSLNSTVFQDIMAWLLNFLDGSDRHEQ